MTGPLVGTSLPRLEDRRLLTGRGRYVDDIVLPDMLHGSVVRSPVAHGRVTEVETADAAAVPGVVAIFTGADLDRLGVLPMPCLAPVDSSDGTPFHMPERPVLARDVVRHVGDPVAFVVAETPEAALEGAEAVFVDIEEADPVVDPRRSEEIACVWEDGDAEAVEAAFEKAARVVEIATDSPRIAVSPMEPRAAIGAFDPDGGYTLYTQTQGVMAMRNFIAKTLGIGLEEMRVVTPDVGGSFGIKIMNYPEQTLVCAAAKDLGRPVKWISSRAEGFLTDLYGRAQYSDAAMALDEDGRIIALRVNTRGDLGAYASVAAPGISSKGFGKTLGHNYAIPAMHVRTTCVYTHTVPTDAYRGAGKPEAQYLLERLIEKAARELGVDQADFRRRNLVTPAMMPYETPFGFKYDSGDFPAALDEAVTVADWAGFEDRRAASEARGCLRGRGIGCYLHLTGGNPAETSRVTVEDDGTVAVRTGVQASGQGHETAFAQLVADRLAVPVERIRVIEGDSSELSRGGGTGGSSSLPIAAATIARASDALIEAAKPYAADMLEAAPEDLEYAEGAFTIVGTDRSIGLFDLAERLDPEEKAAACAGMADQEGETQTVPHGCYIAEVEIDRETGRIRLERYTCVDDLGVRLNPMIAEGQLYGGLVQAIGQALHERVVYDEASGQLVSGSFMDYGLPRADDLPELTLHGLDQPTDVYALGMKGAGEVSAIGGIAPVVNAVCDALDRSDIRMPVTSESVWRMLHGLE